MSKLDDELLTEFMHTFYGYGNLRGDYWLIGMEEGVGKVKNTEDFCRQITARLSAWEQRGKRELEDVAEYHATFGVTSLFAKYPSIQPTWGRLIRLLLAAEGGEQIEQQQVREFQRDRLARPNRLDSNHCLLELLPLPSRSTKAHEWIYNECSNLKSLETRAEYRTTTAPFRIEYLQKLIADCQPPYVIFYGSDSTYRSYWKKIAGVPFTMNVDINCDFGRNSTTVFIIAKHPTAYVTKDYFPNIGRFLRTSAVH